MPLREAIPLLQQTPNRCLAVTENDRLVGLFSDRDMVERCFSVAVTEDTPVGVVMDAPVLSLPPDTSVAEALLLIDEERIRHLPLVEANGTLRGLLRGRDLLEYVAECIPELLLNQPPETTRALAREGA